MGTGTGTGTGMQQNQNEARIKFLDRNFISFLMQANLLWACGNKWVVKSAKRAILLLNVMRRGYINHFWPFEGGLYENGFEKKDL